MARCTVKVIVEAEAGPNYRASLDCLDLCAELLALLPEWHEQEREELRTRMLTVGEMLNQTMRASVVSA